MAVKAKPKATPKAALKAKPAPKKTGSKAKTVKKTTPSTVFQLHAPNATEISLAGEFNNWDPSKHKMRKYKGDIWKKSMKLKSGRYEYKFVVDGDWWTDPENQECCRTEDGCENSVITI
ncbi:glycoside hydrolase family 13 [Thermodesulfobacteriota bacterium]